MTGVGKDVFIYSITIDPDTDTPAVLKDYREKFKANWTFLTGDEVEIVQLRKKLGLYIAEIQDGSNNHNVSMIIGNQKTGRWMRRSPFENAHVLADQIGNWLDGWKAPQPDRDYASAPELRSVSTGERLFRTRCSHCHTVTGHEATDAIGPDLLGVAERRQLFWLLNWLRAPDQMIANKDPIAMGLLAKYNNVPMPNMRLNQLEATAIINYLKEQTRIVRASNLAATQANAHQHKPGDGHNHQVTISNAWIREAKVPNSINAGYFTLSNVTDQPVVLTGVHSPAFERIELHHMSHEGGMMTMEKLTRVEIPANGQISFAPGGKHLMMHQPKREFKAGQWLRLTLNFASGHKQALNIQVEDR